MMHGTQCSCLDITIDIFNFCKKVLTALLLCLPNITNSRETGDRLTLHILALSVETVQERIIVISRSVYSNTAGKTVTMVAGICHDKPIWLI